MDLQEQAPVTNPKERRTLWPGLLLGSLLTLFMVAFVYVAYSFLVWGQAAASQAPKLPPLALPRLVREASSVEVTRNRPLDLLLAPMSTGKQESEPVVTDRVTVLIMGVDNRPGQQVARTDTIIVLTVDPRAHTAGMLSLPRDLLVPAPALNDSVKINTLHVIGEINKYPGGGPALLRDTVSDLLGYPIDYYVRVNFDGFRQIVDLIGGIDIDVAREIRDDEFPDDNYGFDPLYIPAGRQHMDGEMALKYARVRHIDTDYQRADRQQQVILAVKNKLTEPGQLASLLPRLPGLTIAMANSVQTDMPVERAIALARLMGQIDLQNPTRVVVDNTMGTVSLDPVKGYILTPDMNKLRTAAAAVFGTNIESPSTADTAHQVLQDEAARLIVLNGTADAGLAARTAAGLSTLGFNIVAIGNAAQADFAQTTVITHGDGAPATLEALVQRFSISPDRILSDPPSDTVDLTLVVGADQIKTSAAP
jgi:LCP family protein required for cell wall assembly